LKISPVPLLAAIFVLSLPCDSIGGEPKTNSALRFLAEARASGRLSDRSDGGAGSVTGSELVTVTIKFDHVLSSAEIEGYENEGFEFFRIDGEVARTRSIYPVRLSWENLASVDARVEILRMEAAWRPAVFPALDVSLGEIEADSAWSYDDPLGYPITGRGLRVADFDTGIDVFHPSFFQADGDTFDWVDHDGDGEFISGNDAVDLNGNGSFDVNESLKFYDGLINDWAGVWGASPANNDNMFQAYWDWLYADQNFNNQRDFGPGGGFSESTPGYGEPVFIALDENGNDVLDIGEKLVQLETSKIYATMNAGSVERIRGTDLIYSDHDDNGHGTAVMGIVGGGTRGRHRFCGIAPDAELLAGSYFSAVPISYLVPWARSRGADVMLYEFGGFIWEYLDGSSLDEEIISIENETIIQITPSGNLGRGDKHSIVTVPSDGSVVLNLYVPPSVTAITEVYSSVLWRTDTNHLSVTLISPLTGEVTLVGGDQYVDNYYVWSDRDESSRGTCKLDIFIEKNIRPNLEGLWHLHVENDYAADIEIISNVADNVSSWAGGAEWLNYTSDDRNVTWPATCDSAFCNGSYSTRGFEGYGGVGSGSIPPGEISAFSGRGPRWDSKRLVDICSPGNYDVYTTISHTASAGYAPGGYRQFSGTSAAGPHVAAAAALLIQAFPTASPAQIAYRLSSNAGSDEFTGIGYNFTWGYGKLRILRALGVLTNVEEIVMGARPPSLTLDQNYPNPFNPTTWIPFYLPRKGRASIKIFDVRGGLVRVIRDRTMSAGAHSVVWNGRSDNGKQVPSGVYFCVLEHEGEKQTRKLVVLR
jgi:subtilisin family serine protease